MPKINAIVPEGTRKELKDFANKQDTTVQAVAALAIATGLKAVKAMPAKQLAKLLQPDGRRTASA